MGEIDEVINFGIDLINFIYKMNNKGILRGFLHICNHI